MTTSQKIATSSNLANSCAAPKNLIGFGFARVREKAFAAIRELWAKRIEAGWDQKRLAEVLDKDPAWISRNLSGPGNWTLKTFGAFAEAMNGEVEIIVRDRSEMPRKNFDAYESFFEGGRAKLLHSGPPSFTPIVADNRLSSSEPRSNAKPDATARAATAKVLLNASS